MPSRAIWLISGSGLVPFLVCLALAYGAPELRDAAVRTFIVYSALTLTFLGGARWGAELVRAPEGPNLGRLVASAGPSVVGLGALLPHTPAPLAIGLLLVSSGAQLAWDVAGARRGLLPGWNGRVRTVMTVLGTVCTLALWPVVG
jgi:hypothetical protein